MRQIAGAMRETRFYEYMPVDRGHLHEIASLKHWNSNPSYNAPYTPPPVTGGGLAGSTVAWRIDAGSTIILESMLNRSAIRLSFPGALSCLPVVKTRESAEQLLVLASFVTDAGCELVLLHCEFPDAKRSSENMTIQKTQHVIDEDIISVLHASADGELFYGLASGQCGQVALTAGYQSALVFTLFEAPSADRDGDESETGSNNTELSRNSAVSSASKSFLGRLLTPRPPRASPPETTARARTSTAASFRDSLPFATPRTNRASRNVSAVASDKIEALLTIQLDQPCLLALHALGRVVVYAKPNNAYKLAGEGKLPVTLAKDHCRQFLLKESHDKIFAVLTVDENPQPNSVRVFSISVKQQITKAIIVSFRSLVKRQGPIDRLVGAALVGGGIVVGAANGVLSGPLNSGEVEENGVGLPVGNMWTAVDDVERAGGLGSFVKTLTEDPRERLLAAHRFSAEVLVKAVRLNDLPDYARATVEKRIRVMTFGENEEENCDRAVSRAERLTVDADMPLEGLQVMPGAGLVAARKCGLFVFRKLRPVEAQTLKRSIAAFDEPDMLSGPVAWFASSQAAVQILCSDFAVLEKSNASYKNLEFMIRQALLFSESVEGMAVTDRMVMDGVRKAQISIDDGDITMDAESDFDNALEHVRTTLEPGGKALAFLSHSNEMNALRLSAEFSADYVPISSYFATGLAWLTQYRNVESALKEENVMADDATARRDSDSGMLDVNSETAATLLERAYGSLVTAAKFANSDKGEASPEDIDCVLELAKLSPNFGDKDAVMQTERGSSPIADADKESLVEHLGYWLLERCVRLLEASGSPKSAAAAALAAMKSAPDRIHYETMRAAAFGRFLDAGSLDHAYIALTMAPFSTDPKVKVTLDEADALRDAWGLFVNAVADKGELKWLSKRDVPEPLRTMVGMALERRARASEPINVEAELRVLDWPTEIVPAVPRKLNDYEQLYAWHADNEDYQSAAFVALEWAERLATEGLVIVAEATIPGGGMESVDARLRMLVAWARMKTRAYSFAMAGMQLLDDMFQYFARSKFSVMAQGGAKEPPGVVPVEWVARRQMLAHAQSVCLARMVGGKSDGDGGTVSYLLAHGAPYMKEGGESLRWVVGTLVANPTTEGLQTAMEVVCAWTDEDGPSQVTFVVEAAAKIAADGGEKAFGYEGLHGMLKEVRAMSADIGVERNWALVALKSALAASAGASVVPEWLVAQAAWGVAGEAGERYTGKLGNGDVGGVARAFMMCNQPVDAAKVILSTFRNARNRVDGSDDRFLEMQKCDLPWMAIEGCLAILQEAEEEGEGGADEVAGGYRRRLHAVAEGWLEGAEREFKGREEAMLAGRM